MNTTSRFFDFISAAPTSYHAAEKIKSILTEKGFTELSEKDAEAYRDGGAHFVIRSDSTLIAFKGGRNKESFMISASHSDTPCFKLTSLSETTSLYSTLATERHGGIIHYSWLDRPLSLAGRICVRDESGISVRLFDLKRDLLTIPSIAIHLNQTVNEGYKFNPAKDLQPLFSIGTEKGALRSLIAQELSVRADDIISSDVFVYNREQGRTFGYNDELILAPRLDNLASVFTTLEAFLSAPERDDAVCVLAVFDNEETGSSTKQGANSTVLCDVLMKIAGSFEKYTAMLTDSFMVSADNAHAKHPTYPELSNPSASCVLGGGVAVKYNANQRYATDAVSEAVFSTLAKRAGAKIQTFASRPDMLCGSTLGSISTTRVAVCTVDVGLPQLAMHSASESMAKSDLDDMIKVLTEMYSSRLVREGSNIVIK